MTFSFIHFNTYLRDWIKFNTNDLIFRDLVNKEFIFYFVLENSWKKFTCRSSGSGCNWARRLEKGITNFINWNNCLNAGVWFEIEIKR